MKILYGVQATGNGHISRSRAVVAALKKCGHEVHVLLSGRDARLLWEIDAFKPYSIYGGLTFATSAGKLRYGRTIRELRVMRFFQDIAAFEADDFDLVITDFEPLAARIARRNRIPSIGLGHQYSFRYPIPLAKRDPLALLVLRYFAPVDHVIGLHYHHFHHPILPPIVADLDKSEVSSDSQKVLVYLPFEDIPAVVNMLKDVRKEQFYCYASVKASHDEGNIHLRPFSRRNFINDLKICSGVIANAGFTLTSEALYLGKKLLVKPLVGQFEQTSNALALQQLNLGMVMQKLDARAVVHWLSLPSPEPVEYPDVAEEVAAWIGRGQWNTIGDLASRVWGMVRAGRT
jgi:uncharacterized protein (TIGR00661 family)